MGFTSGGIGIVQSKSFDDRLVKVQTKQNHLNKIGSLEGESGSYLTQALVEQLVVQT